MRKYKAVVLDLRAVVKTVGCTMMSAIVTLAAFNSIRNELSASSGAEEVLQNTSAIFEIENKEGFFGEAYLKAVGESFSKVVAGCVIGDTQSVLSGAIPIYGEVLKREKLIVSGAEKTDEYVKDDTSSEKFEEEVIDYAEENIPEENRAEIKNISVAQKPAQGCPVAIGNETSYSIDVSRMLSKEPDIDMTVEGPKVLITHTHATESYSANGAKVYDIKASDRNEDTSKNVVAVGERLADILNGNGIEALHDTVLHDVPSFNGSYAHSLNTVEEYLKKYPSIQIVFDVHRDSVVYDDNAKARTITKINGQEAAQLMFVVGTDEKGLYNPEWKENLTSAIHFQTAITQKYPDLMRHINLRKERFNGHTTHSSMIIEVGTSGNSLNEAFNAVEAAGACISDYLNSL